MSPDFGVDLYDQDLSREMGAFDPWAQITGELEKQWLNTRDTAVQQATGAVTDVISTGGNIAQAVLNPQTGEPMRDAQGNIIYRQVPSLFDQWLASVGLSRGMLYFGLGILGSVFLILWLSKRGDEDRKASNPTIALEPGYMPSQINLVETLDNGSTLYEAYSPHGDLLMSFPSGTKLNKKEKLDLQKYLSNILNKGAK